VKLLDSLLDALVRLEGDALVMHVGEKPYVVTASSSMNAYRGPLAWGQVELSTKVLTFEAMSSMLPQVLPPERQVELDEFGAVEQEIQSPPGVADRFTIVAARGGEDVWLELRRRPLEVPEPKAVVEQPLVEPALGETIEPELASEPEISQAADERVETAAVSDSMPDVEMSVDVGQESMSDQTIEIQAGDEDVHIELVAAAAEDDEYAHESLLDQQVADASPVNVDSIVVTLPGQRQMSLGNVANDAIQIVDEEPQGVPTDEEVDALLATAAAALMTPDVQADEDEDEDQDENDDVLGETAYDRFTGADTEVPAGPAEPVFELSPPPLMLATIAESEDLEPVFVAVGAPLFEEAAMAAAAAAEAPAAVMGIAVEERPAERDVAEIPAAATVEYAPELVAAEAAALEDADLDSDEREMGTVHPIEAPPPVDDASDIVERTTDLPIEATMGMLPTDGTDPMVSPETPQGWAPIPSEMHMDPTTDSRYDDAAVRAADRSQSWAVEKPEAPPYAAAATEAEGDAASRSGVVAPLARTAVRAETAPVTPPADAALIKTLQAAAARGAVTVYVVAQSRPTIRVNGEISALETEPVLSAADVDRLVMELAPPRRRDALQNGPVEWLCDVPEIGRVRCQTFRDHRGPGVIFRMFPPRAISADQLGLTPEVQALCQQSDGLVLVTGARASGKSTLLNAFVDLINRTRSDHVITIESQIGFVHESRRSFISQREVHGDSELAATLVRAALRESPDVMMIEDVKAADIAAAALEAAESGCLVLASLPGSSTIGALDKLIESFPADRRARARTSLATSLRGVVAQVLLRRVKGGQVAAREVLLNTPAVSQLVLEGKTSQLPVALDSGRRHGMVPLTDSLAAHVREGNVHAAEAYRKAIDRAALLAQLKREGVDTSFAERLA
jgi:twitching motility protein PilT